MTLKSALFTQDISVDARLRLESCLVHDNDHIVPESSGEHVQKIQLALMRLSNIIIPAHELNFKGKKQIGFYGPITASAVFRYKSNHIPKILNLALHQVSPDNIVGKRTLEFLDSELPLVNRPTNPIPSIPSDSVPTPVESRIISKVTLSKIFQSSSSIGLNPLKLPEPGKPLGDFLVFLAGRAVSDQVSRERQREHPLEKDDPDFGVEKFRRVQNIRTNFVMKTVNVNVILTVEPLLIPAGVDIITERQYQYKYGVGLASDNVSIVRRLIIPATPDRVQTVSETTLSTRQPNNFVDP